MLANLPFHWLTLPIRQRSPQPFTRTEQKVFEPGCTIAYLQNPYREHDKIDFVKLHLSEIVEPISEKDEGTDQRVNDVIGERHLANSA